MSPKLGLGGFIVTDIIRGRPANKNVFIKNKQTVIAIFNRVLIKTPHNTFYLIAIFNPL
jgi:hypothetical protein